MYLDDGYYDSPKTLVEALNLDKESRVKFSYDSVTQKMSAHLKRQTKFRLYGDLSDILGFGNITSDADHTVTLPANSVVDLRRGFESLYVYSSMVEPRVVGDKIVPLLRIVPIRPVDCKVYSIPQGAMSHTHENLFLGTLPKRLILWCIDNDAYNGNYAKNPFKAKNNAINFLAVYVDGRQVPAKPLQPNFENGSYIRSYVNLFSATGKHAQDEGNELTRDDFGNGYTFFGFDLTPDGCDGGCFHLVRKGNLRIEIHFAAALAQTVNVVVYGEFEAVLEIDKGRNVIYDY